MRFNADFPPEIRPKIAQYPLGELKMASKVFTKPLSTSEEEKQVILKSIWDRDNPTWKTIEDELASACDELFGCPGHHYSCTPADETSGPFTNHLLLPTPEEVMDLKQFHWPVFSKTVPSEPEWRSQLYHLFHTIGSSLVSSPNPLALFVAILHTLLGWLAMFQLGYFHRDPSIGNLLRLAEAVAMKKFEIDLRLAPDAIDDLIVKFRHLGLNPLSGSLIVESKHNASKTYSKPWVWGLMHPASLLMVIMQSSGTISMLPEIPRVRAL
ncbi:hypothetical protein MIND_00153800 [Mycena indigotica]|uniref:Fungal-type protein kinase domain-containing protein n=1 Tax=Mycena indigotica TaxID=2126181 RepID=A0A8H6TF32_9AGAR|nr:uncharacterized protein MIND_00153800 [Mycena indigotica]KAF7316350.1 hypothetical protein MIND_00153800 [Mycena indigotica]